MKTLEQLERELEQVNAALERNAAEGERVSGARLNPAGDIGGIRSRSKKRKRQIAERRDALAAESVRLVRERDRLQTTIANLKAAPGREAVKERARISWRGILRDKLQKGDEVEVMPYRGTFRVVRVNKASVTVERGGASDFSERVSYAQIKPLRWEEMLAEWKEEKGSL